MSKLCHAVYAFLLVLFLSFAAFAQEQADNQATNTGLVYFYRVEEAPSLDSRKTKVRLNEKFFIAMPEEQFVGFRMLPGKYALRQRQKQSEMQLTVEAGKTYFVRISQTIAGFGFNQSITIMPNEQAAFQMRDMKPLRDDNIKIKTIQIVRENPTP